MRLWPILLLALATPALAAEPSQGPPDFGIDASGVFRNLNVRDAVLGARVPMGYIDTGSHNYLPATVVSTLTGAVTNYHPRLAPEFIRTQGYSIIGTGGGLYAKAASQPTHPYRFSITDAAGATVWYGLAPSERPVNFEQLGAIGDDAVDDTAAVTAALNTSTGLYPVSGLSKTYHLSGSVTMRNGTVLQDAKFIQDAPADNVRTLTNNCGAGLCVGPFTLKRVKVDRGTNAKAGTPSGMHGIMFTGVTSNVLMEDVEVTGLGFGSGITIWGDTDKARVTLVRPYVHDITWWGDLAQVNEGAAGIVVYFTKGTLIDAPRVENIKGLMDWKASTSISVAGQRVYATANGKSYRTVGLTGPITTGTTAPNCSTGTCSDGTVTWEYLGTGTTAATVSTTGNTDGIDSGGNYNLTMRGAIIQNVAEGWDASGDYHNENVWLYDTSYIDCGVAEAWKHYHINSGSIGSRAIRSSFLAFVVTGAQGDETESGISRGTRIINALSYNIGQGGDHASYAAKSGFTVLQSPIPPTDIQFINARAIDDQTVHTMDYGFRNEPGTAAAMTLINPYVSGAKLGDFANFPANSTGITQMLPDGSMQFAVKATGASTPRTAPNRAADLLSVEDFGAIGDDGLDDKVAIQAALNAAGTRCVTGAGKTYRINNDLLLPNGSCLQDIKLIETATGARRPITSNCSGPGPTYPSCEGPFTLRRVRVDRGNTDSSTDSAGIWLSYAVKGILMEDVEVTGNGAGNGLMLPFSKHVRLVRPWVHDMEWTNTTGIDPGIEQMTGLACSLCKDVTIIDPRIENLWGTIPWVAGQNLAPSQGNPWRTNAGNAYRATTFGATPPTTSGTTAPTCTGTPGVTTCSDGNKTWTYMGPAATTKRAYQADGMGLSGLDGATIIGGQINYTWEGVDIGASNNVWLYGVTFEDSDSWAEKWCHGTKNSGSVGMRAIRPGVGGVVACGSDPGPIYVSHLKIMGATVVNAGASKNWGISQTEGFDAADVDDVQFINTTAVDNQTVPTMLQGYRSEALSAPLGPILINPVSVGHTGSARVGLYASVLEGPYGTATTANTGTTGHVVPFLDTANSWSAQQRLTSNAAGAQTIPLVLINSGNTPNTEVAIDLSPTNNAPGVRSAQVASVTASGSGDANLIFRTANGGVPATRVTISAAGLVTLTAGLKFTPIAVSSLGTCDAAAEGTMRAVTDANSLVFNAAVAAGGANHMMAYCNGTGWVIR